MKRIATALGCALLLGCGARTGLPVPDGGFDGGIDACVEDSVSLSLTPAEVLFVLDRSNSMFSDVQGLPTMRREDTRWVLLGEALDSALRGEPLVVPGAAFFPASLRDGEEINAETACRSPEFVQVPFSRNALDEINEVFESSEPFGGTPTTAVLQTAWEHLQSNPNPQAPRFIVLATDGGPNCNLADPELPCRCSGNPETCENSAFGTANCLDDNHTIEVLEEIVGSGVPVYVIGFGDPQRPDLTAIMNAMAVAGGRPQAGRTQFFDVQRAADLETAFAEITGEVSRCNLGIPGDLNIARLSLSINGAPLQRDRDWRLDGARSVRLLGQACRTASVEGVTVEARLTCDL